MLAITGVHHHERATVTYPPMSRDHRVSNHSGSTITSGLTGRDFLLRTTCVRTPPWSLGSFVDS